MPQVKVKHAQRLIANAFQKDLESKGIVYVNKLFVQLVDEERQAIWDGVDTLGFSYTWHGFIVENLKQAVNHVAKIRESVNQRYENIAQLELSI